jgi:hypothetical protein
MGRAWRDQKPVAFNAAGHAASVTVRTRAPELVRRGSFEARLNAAAPFEAALVLCSLNPWHGESWRSGWLRFRVARTFGYGADDVHTSAMLHKLDSRGIGGELELLRSIDHFLPVSTQGTV